MGATRRQALALLIVLTAALAAAYPAFGDRIGDKQAEAERVMGEITQLDAQLEHAINAYDQATVELTRIQHSLHVNTKELGVARHSLHRAEGDLATRLRLLYIRGSGGTTIDVLIGARSLDDLINRIDTVNRVSDQATAVLGEVQQFRRMVVRERGQLRHAKARQVELVQERARQKADIESGLAQRQELLSSIKDEIARLQAEEAARQAELRAQLAARLAAQQEAQQQALVDSPVGASAVTPQASAPPPSQYGGVVGIAMQYLGTPYVWGGESPGGFDCSGFVAYVYAQVGISLPHYTGAQWNTGSPVSADQLEPGDLVFFNGLGHVGNYIGGGQFIHAPHTGDVVKISSLSDSWYASSFDGGRRL
jgi:cell wall-associated NlpC family hydrolase